MLFSKLTEYFDRINKTSLRNEKTVILAEILKEATAQEVDKLVYLALGGLRPAFDRLEFNMAEKMILRAIGTTNEEYQKVGDLGELVVSSRAKSRDPSTTVGMTERRVGMTERRVGMTERQIGMTSQSVSEVYGELTRIAREGGSGSQERKVMLLGELIKEVEAQSAKYIVRIVAGKLRLGFSDKTVIDALSYMENGTKDFSDELDRAYQKRPDVGVLAQTVKEKGVKRAIESIDVVMGTPIVPALAQRLKTAKEMIEKMGKVYCEPKYDGTRVQIHFSRKIGSQSSELESHWVRTFTRNLDESSAMFPELSRIADQIKADEVILDSEAVGYDPKTGKLVPFQLTITRKRKHGVTEVSGSVPLRFFVFDIMYLNGQSLIHLPLRERRKILAETIVQGHNNRKSSDHSPKIAQGSELGEGTELGPLVVDEFIETDDPNVLRAYHKKQLEEGLEGALVKQINGEYMPGRTGFNWVKFKEAEDSRAKLADTLDVVIMGYYLGKGKRQKFGVGAFLVGIKDSTHSRSVGALHSGSVGDEDEILTLAKVGTGITDQVFAELGERLKKIETRHQTPGYKVPKTLEPDVWVEPKIVVEVAADEITASPTHSAGYALRFPRLVKFRDDKSLEQITTLTEVRGMYGV